jgi:DNA helicase-2/ATP-dependent DNA helicase PcrA
MGYLEELNESQLAAVKHVEGPSMVIAGAGSGKTRVLTFRIAYMMENGVDPFNIMALTFTNKAAKEMKERIGSIVGAAESKNITMGTFHSVFSRILRYNADRLGFPSNFTIYDTQDSKSLIKAIVKECNLDEKLYKPSGVFGRISSAKNNLISPDAYAQNSEIMLEDKQSKRPEIARLYKIYAHRCFKAGAMDFDDLLYQTNVLLRDFPDVLSYYQNKFRYVLVDEYQDTNFAQYLIVKKIAAVYENICVVGDDAQSIYSFRGANIENIFNFRKDYPDYKLYKLEQNYRSTKTIVEAANSIIVRNQDQIEKNVWTDNIEGGKIKVIRTMTDNEEGKVVVNKIYDKKQGEGLSFSDFAILYRTNKQSRAFEESLRKQNMPYKIFGGLSFYQRKEIKDILAYFRLTTNPQDEEALKRVINYPKRGIGKTTIENLIIKANEHDVSIWELICHPAQYNFNLNAGTMNKIQGFVRTVQSFQAQLEKLNAHDLAQEIARQSGVLKELFADKDKGVEEVERYQNIEQLLSGITEFTVTKAADGNILLSDFLMDVALLTDADKLEDDKNYVTLMTIHSSKGLEFQHVYLVGMEENLFPSQMVLNSRKELEEERRLFYVAVTRAKNTCTLSHASSRFVWGQLNSSEPSRFISEIDSIFLEMESTARPGGRSLNSSFERPFSGGLNKTILPSGNLRSMTSATKGTTGKSVKKSGGDLELKVGYVVEHDRFGKGKITQLAGADQDRKATIFFPRHGAKTVLLRFANITVIEE